MTLIEKNREMIIHHYIKKSYQAIDDAETLLGKRSFTGALNRIYYGIFYILSALAVKNKFSTLKHSQLIGWFNKNYVKSEKVDRKIGRIIHSAFDQRMESDYDPLSEFHYEEIEENLANMKKVISSIEKLVKG